MVYQLTEIDKEHYSFGYCHVFALALHRELGYELNFFWDTLPDMDDLNEDEPNCLIHAFAVSPCGNKYDVKGLILIDEFESVYSKLNPDLIRHETEDTVQKLMWDGILALGEDDEIDILQDYIRDNIKLFS